MARRAQTGAVALTAVLILATIGALFYVGLYIFGSTDPTPWNKPATVNGDTVTFTYTGSECQDGDDVEVLEDSQRVVISVTETVRARSCSEVGVTYDVQVTLDAPLGDRELVDGVCDNDEYAQYSACDPRAATVDRVTR